LLVEAPVIQVHRLPEPTILMRKAEQWTRELCNARRRYYLALDEPEAGLVRERPEYPRARSSRYGHEEIKNRLEKMFGPKCAYCESRVKAVSYQHVEH
jgi:hypothetical protein